jgi:hypothetical protein
MWLNRYHRSAEDCFFAVPNGGLRTQREAATLKATGTKSGVPDTMLALPRGRYAGAFIEFKTPDGILSPTQKVFIARLRANGFAVVVIDSLEAFQHFITDYLALTGDQELPSIHYYRWALA